MNLLKCIELVCAFADIGKITDKKTKKKRGPYTKEFFELAGKKMGVSRDNIKYAKRAWDSRNNADIAHKHLYKSFGDINYDLLDKSANDYLIKYFRWSKSSRKWFY